MRSVDVILKIYTELEDVTMTTYNFDERIDRTNTTSVKHAFKKEFHLSQDVIPLWVADMDFRSPKEVCEAVEQAGKFGIFGYADSHDDYFDAIHSWMLRRHGWNVQKDWLVRTPGVVCAIAAAVHAFTCENDSVMIMQPVYHPFKNVLTTNHRHVVKHILKTDKNNRFYADFEEMERQIETEQVKLLILCTPHNPGGRIWTREELQKIAEICLRHQVLVFADEIHHDFILPGHTFTEWASISEEMNQNSIIGTAPSKTFNIAGLGLSNIFIPNPKLRKKFVQELHRSCIDANNVIALDACKAAYTFGETWLEELLVYLQGNVDFVRSFLKEHLPHAKMMEPDGTYLLWIDFSSMALSANMTHAEFEKFLLEKAGVWMNNGTMFGDGGCGCFRMNIGCPRSVLEQALKQIKEAADTYL